ncbi:MAG: glycosyltransferase [Candidatus Marinimicrobia bacterium]|mgnify:CR=1 FL=1|jgi:glycosyltransferase involved in cell wall biosynthesis|nr:glycosyltransferase [Candidatus Neomarinimicrobiota bacterium]
MHKVSYRKIAIYLPNLAGGGVERAYLELAYSLSMLGASVDLVLLRRIGPYIAEIPDSVCIVELHATRKFNAVLKLARYLRREKPAVLLSGGDVSNAVALVASILAGRTAQCVISQRAMMLNVWQAQKPKTWWVWMAVLKMLYRRANLIICNSEAARHELIDNLGFEEAKCQVIYNAVDIDHIQRQAETLPDDPWFSPGHPPVIISVGSLSPLKDMTTLIRAFAIVRQSHTCHLIILGEGPERGRLEALVRECNLERYVHMPGFVSNPFPMIQRAQVLVNASLTEGCPNVLLQALACGTPIVATDCPGGSSEILENGRWGRLVPVGNAKTMATAIIRTLDGDLPPDGRERAMQFNRERTASLYLERLIPVLPTSKARHTHFTLDPNRVFRKYK